MLSHAAEADIRSGPHGLALLPSRDCGRAAQSAAHRAKRECTDAL